MRPNVFGSGQARAGTQEPTHLALLLFTRVSPAGCSRPAQERFSNPAVHKAGSQELKAAPNSFTQLSGRTPVHKSQMNI